PGSGAPRPAWPRGPAGTVGACGSLATWWDSGPLGSRRGRSVDKWSGAADAPGADAHSILHSRCVGGDARPRHTAFVGPSAGPVKGRVGREIERASTGRHAHPER